MQGWGGNEGPEDYALDSVPMTLNAIDLLHSPNCHGFTSQPQSLSFPLALSIACVSKGRQAPRPAILFKDALKSLGRQREPSPIQGPPLATLVAVFVIHREGCWQKQLLTWELAWACPSPGQMWVSTRSFPMLCMAGDHRHAAYSHHPTLPSFPACDGSCCTCICLSG